MGCSEGFIEHKKIIAESVYKQEVARWEKDKSSNKTEQWVNKVVDDGTIRDKINGWVHLIQQSPFHRIATLDELLGLTLSPTTRKAILAIESVKTLFFNCYLPDTKLSFFAKHFESISEEEAEQVSMQDLVRWYYEDSVKSRYASFIQALEKAAHSSLQESKSVAIGTLQKMLISKPEQEQTILSLLVDKIGDPNSKTANWTVNLLLGVLEQHPSMKDVMVKEVQLFINKHTPLKTTVPLGLLSHVVLNKGDVELANRLVATYFRQLKVLSEQKRVKRSKSDKRKAKKAKKVKTDKPAADDDEEGATEGQALEASLDTKMVSVLLTGVNRAFPYAKLPQDVYESHLEILFSLVEHGGFNRKVLALSVIFKVIQIQQEVSDNLDTVNRTRFYHLLYDLLLSAELGSGFGQPNYRQAFFLLVHGAILADKDVYRARAFVKRLLVMAANARPGFACSALLIASQLFQATPLSNMATNLTAPTNPKNFKPDPQFQTEGKNSCLWEVCALKAHSHPLVARWAQSLSANQPISYNGNPIDDLSLNSFLSRIQNKQPSSKERVKGKVKAMQPKKKAPTALTYSFTLKDFQNKKESEIRPDELFFYKFLQYKISMVEREDQSAAGGKHRKKGKVSQEALEGLLEADADDDNFGLEGVGLDDEDEDDDEDDGVGSDVFGATQRGTKRKENPTTGKETKKPSKPNKKAKVTSKINKKKAKKTKVRPNGPLKTKVAKRNKRK